MSSQRLTSITDAGIAVDHGAPEPLNRQLYERLRLAILTGQIEAGARLPSTRTLAGQLGISRTTTTMVYEQLQLEGYIESRVGDGARVTQLSLGRRSVDETRAGTSESAQRGRDTRHLSAIDSAAFGAFQMNDVDASRNVFRAGVPDVSQMPWNVWARLLARHARQSLPGDALYQDVRGIAQLREAIAAHIVVTRGVRCTPEQIIITVGAQGALNLAARVLLAPGDAVWVEDPGYLGSRGTVYGVGAQVVPVPVDAEGLVVDAGRAQHPDARMVIVTPSHQFPTAVTMSLSRRLALLEWANASGAWIVEDDYDSEFRYSGRPLEALQALDHSHRVLYIGTFSKVLFPSLRLGYLVAPPELLDVLLMKRRFIDIHPPLLEQLALADFLTEGYFARHVRRMRDLYRQRRNALIEALSEELGDTLDVTAPEAGLHLVGWLPAGTDMPALLQAAAREHMHLSPISQFAVQPLTRDGLHLGFARATPDELWAGVRELAPLLRD